jgi:transposase-like protein
LFRQSAIYRCLFGARLSPKGKKQCLHLYLERNGFRRIERLTGVSHNTVINWVKEVGNSLSTEPYSYEIPEIAQIDELHTYVGKKKLAYGCGQL